MPCSEAEQPSTEDMKIGILGSRGIPNQYGGYEQFAQYLSEGLIARGHQVYVYCSSLHPYRDTHWKGVALIRKFDPENHLGAFGQFIYDFLCLRDADKRNFDILLQLGYTSSAVWHRFWPKNTINIIHMDGLEWQRAKYSSLVRKFLKLMEQWAAEKGQALIADSTAIQDHLQLSYGRPATFIPYGAEIPEQFDPEYLEKYGLTPGNYFLAIARMEPENNLEAIIEGYLKAAPSQPLVLIGSTSTRFGAFIAKRYPHPNIRLLGPVYEKRVLDSLRYHCLGYFHGHSVGGTNPSLLEAMACQCIIYAHDNPFNQSVLGANARYFKDENDIFDILHQLTDKRQADIWKSNNLRLIHLTYNWPAIVQAYGTLFIKLRSESSTKAKT